jgi:hypothetical protein
MSAAAWAYFADGEDGTKPMVDVVNQGIRKAARV